MGKYLAKRIIEGVYSYDYVIGKRGDLKDSIDECLKQEDKENLITS
ncbi:MAG: hypothetical protein ACQEQF_00700 [Bacillota bacterium]